VTANGLNPNVCCPKNSALVAATNSCVCNSTYYSAGVYLAESMLCI